MKSQTKSVEILEFQIREVTIPIVGISPLIVHRFSEKAIKMIQDKQAGKAKNKKHDIRDPEGDFEGAKHVSVLGWEGFPAAGFKAAMIRGAKMIGMLPVATPPNAVVFGSGYLKIIDIVRAGVWMNIISIIVLTLLVYLLLPVLWGFNPYSFPIDLK
jgi:hypothetical protein